MVFRIIMLSTIFTVALASGVWGTPPKKTAPASYSGMVLIPKGAFEMGSRRSLRELNPVAIFQADRHMLGPEDPAHEVILDEYYIDIHEITNADYKKYLAATGSKNLPRYWDDSNFNQSDQPVVGVTWKEAQDFCQWGNKQLPTEAEWEKAARGKRPVKYPWGDEEPDKTRANFNNHIGKTTAVGSYPTVRNTICFLRRKTRPARKKATIKSFEAATGKTTPKMSISPIETLPFQKRVARLSVSGAWLKRPKFPKNNPKSTYRSLSCARIRSSRISAISVLVRSGSDSTWALRSMRTT
jgi:hypothetical protein